MRFEDPTTLSDDQLTAEIERLELLVVEAYATYPITWVRDIEGALNRALVERSGRPRIRRFVIDDGGLAEMFQMAMDFQDSSTPDEIDALERTLTDADYDSFGPTTDIEQAALEGRIGGRRIA